MNLRKSLLLSTMAVVLSCVGIGNAFAVETNNANNASTTSNSTTGNDLFVNDDGMVHIGVSPYDVQIELSPGMSYTGTFKVLNDGGGAINYTLKVTPFQVSDNSYTPDYSTTSSINQIVDWIALDESKGYLPSGKSQEVTYHINVPEDVAPGGQYATITAIATKEADPDESQGVSIAISVGAAMIIYGNVNGGETRTEATIETNNIPGFVLSGNVQGVSSITNTGNTHIEANYALEVYPLFSEDILYDSSELADNRVIMPDTTRTTLLEWKDTPEIGVFKAVQTITVNGTESKVEQIVVKLPIWAIAIIGILLFVVAFLIIFSITKKRHAKAANNHQNHTTNKAADTASDN